MKNVLHIRSSGEFLGAENVVLQLSNFSEEFGYKSHVLVIQDHRDEFPLLAEYAQEQNIDCTVIVTSKRIDLSCVSTLKSLIQKHEIDVIHTHGYKEDLYAFLAFSGKPVIATNHLWKKTNATLKLYAFIDSLVLTRFKKIIAVSKAILDEMKSISYLKNHDIELVSNGIDYEKFSDNKQILRTELNIENDTVLLLTVSSLTPEKGHRFLLDALADKSISEKNWHLAITGGGRELDSLKQQVKNLGLSSKVSFIGYRKDIPDLLSSSDLYLLPSLDEGLPMALLEAMAAGKAAIATNVGDVAKVIKNDSVGKLIEAGDSIALAKALYFALENKEWRTLAGNNARELIKSEFSSRSMTSQYCKHYNELL